MNLLPAIRTACSKMNTAMLRIFLCLLAGAASVLAQGNSTINIDDVLDKGLKVPWQDDAIGHPDLIAFREYLRKAAQTHDALAILKVALPDFQGCDLHGINGLQEYLKGPWWSEFSKSLTEGGVLSHDGSSFDSNYAFWTFPSLKVGVFGPEYFSVISRPNVPVFNLPNPHSRKLAILSYNLVVPEEPLVWSGWQRVDFRRGQSGFVDSKYLIDPIGESVRMRRLKGKWSLSAIANYCD
jgi:hypothetical protein